jgi:hypothetical protein
MARRVAAHRGAGAGGDQRRRADGDRQVLAPRRAGRPGVGESLGGAGDDAGLARAVAVVDRPVRRR